MVVMANMWSRQDRLLRNPFCSSASMPFISIYSTRREFIRELNTLEMEDISVIPLWLINISGSCPLFRTKCIIPRYHFAGTKLCLKQAAYNWCKHYWRAVIFRICLVMLLIPTAFPSFMCFIAFLVSGRVIGLLSISDACCMVIVFGVAGVVALSAVWYSNSHLDESLSTCARKSSFSASVCPVLSYKCLKSSFDFSSACCGSLVISPSCSRTLSDVGLELPPGPSLLISPEITWILGI